LATDKNVAIIKKAGNPPRISDKDLYEAQDMAEKVTEALGGAGLLSRIFLLMMVFISQNSPLDHMIPEW
jgi:phosphoribosylglycinamide formyltransferase 2